MGVFTYRRAALAVAGLALLGACGDTTDPEVDKIVEYSCDNPDAPAERLFARGEVPDAEIRWGNGAWLPVTAAQYDDAVVRLCYR